MCIRDRPHGQLIDRVGRQRRTLRQVAHLVGHHTEASPALTGTCRLDRRIERQQVGLRGQILDLGDAGGDRRGALDEIAYRTANGGERMTHAVDLFKQARQRQMPILRATQAGLGGTAQALRMPGYRRDTRTCLLYTSRCV